MSRAVTQGKELAYDTDGQSPHGVREGESHCGVERTFSTRHQCLRRKRKAFYGMGERQRWKDNLQNDSRIQISHCWRRELQICKGKN